MEKISTEADIIFKGTAIFSGPVQDESKPYPDFVAQEAQFNVIKGGLPGAMP